MRDLQSQRDLKYQERYTHAESAVKSEFDELADLDEMGAVDYHYLPAYKNPYLVGKELLPDELKEGDYDKHENSMMAEFKAYDEKCPSSPNLDDYTI